MFLFTLMAMLFLPAGTMDYPEAWLFLAVVFFPVMLVAFYLLFHDPSLLESRLKWKEKDISQRLIVRLGALFYLLAFLTPGFDQRFGWSDVPFMAVALADLFILCGYGLFVRVLLANPYASRIIQVTKGQRVVTTGAYSIVRHPMYVGALIIYLSTPVALGSWWALIPALPLIGVIVARIRMEERLLRKELAGYEEYMRVTKYRLIPGVW